MLMQQYLMQQYTPNMHTNIFKLYNFPQKFVVRLFIACFVFELTTNE